MAAHTNTTDQAATDQGRRRRGSSHDESFTRRPSHGPRRLRRQPPASGTKRASTSTDLVLYGSNHQSNPQGPRPRRTIGTRVAQLVTNASQSLHRFQNRPPKIRTAKVVAVVPAHNEEECIAATIKALLGQTRAPDRIVVVADNCTDRTVQIARSFGRRVTVIETVGNRDRKVGALRTAWQQYVAYGYDYMLDVDADTVLSDNALEELEQELEMSPKVGRPRSPRPRVPTPARWSR